MMSLLVVSTSTMAERLDERCIPQLHFAYTIVVARQQGETEEQLLETFKEARLNGVFGEIDDKAAEMLKRIIHIMFTGPVDTDEQIKPLMIEAQKECVISLYTTEA